MTEQCPSCGGFCKKGCEREDVQPEQRSEQWWKHEVSNAFAQGYEKGRSQREWKGLADEEIAWLWSLAVEAKLENMPRHFARMVEENLRGKNNGTT